LEGDVLVGRPGVEAQDGEVLVVLTGLQEVLGRRALVDEVGVEDVELVALHDLRGRVVEVVVGLVVLVPLEARVHAVEETRLARAVLVGPQVGLARQGHLHAELSLVRAHALLGLAEEDVIRQCPLQPCTPTGLTCHLELLAQEQQSVRVLLGLQHVGVEGQLVGAQQPGAVLASIIVVQALLDQVLLHQHSLPLGLALGLGVLLCLWLRGRPWLRLKALLWVQPARKGEERTGTGMVPSFSAPLRSARARTGARGCRSVPRERPGGLCSSESCLPVAGGGWFPLDDGEEWLTLHPLLLLQLVQLLAQHVLVPLPQPVGA
ncbi:Putative uncharacterized protein encoded by CACTIN-AS1, partial [Acanthisitta chloris]